MDGGMGGRIKRKIQERMNRWVDRWMGGLIERHRDGEGGREGGMGINWQIMIAGGEV